MDPMITCFVDSSIPGSGELLVYAFLRVLGNIFCDRLSLCLFMLVFIIVLIVVLQGMQVRVLLVVCR